LGDAEVDAVSDAGLLIHLSEIGCSAALTIFECVHVPYVVYQEYLSHNRHGNREITESPHIKIHKLQKEKVGKFIRKNALEHLHVGERESLYLCTAIGVKTLLTDDLSVRDSAKSMEITPVGSLGIVLRAFRSGLFPLSEAKQHIENLYEISSLFVTKAIVDRIVKELAKG